MKKILLLSSLFAAASLQAHTVCTPACATGSQPSTEQSLVLEAQSSQSIPRTILGCTLGVSTKQQVINTLKAKGLRLLFNNTDSVAFSGTRHEGVSFGVITIGFYQGKLLNIIFMHNNKELTENEINTLFTNIDNKYDDYYQGNLDGFLTFRDEKTQLSLFSLGLGYSDNYLSQLKDQRGY